MGNRPGKLFCCRLGFVFRWHALKIQLVDDFLVAFQVVEPPDLRRKGVESTIGLLFLAAVATDTVLLQKRRSQVVRVGNRADRDQN